MTTKSGDLKKSVFFILFSSFWFSVMQVCVKLSGGRIPLFEQIFFRNLVTLFLCFFMIIKTKQSFFGSRENRKYLYYRAIFGYAGVCCFFYATNHMSLPDSAILQKSSPVFITIFASLIFKKKATKKKIFSVVLAFIGAAFVVRPKFDSDAFAATICLLSAVFTAGSHIALTIANEHEDPNTIVFFFSLFSSLCSLPFVILNYKTPSLYDILLLVGIGIFAGLGQIFLTLGYRIAPASQVSIYTYSTVIFATVFNFVIFENLTSLSTFVGMILIFCSSLFDYMNLKNLNQT